MTSCAINSTGPGTSAIIVLAHESDDEGGSLFPV